MPWTLTGFGPMRRILGDPAGEDISDEFNRFCERFGIENMTTAAQAPFSNGIVERYGETLKETMRKLKSDLPQQSFEMLLNKAVLAHNALDSHLGFTRRCLALKTRRLSPETTSAASRKTGLHPS